MQPLKNHVYYCTIFPFLEHTVLFGRLLCLISFVKKMSKQKGFHIGFCFQHFLLVMVITQLASSIFYINITTDV